MVQQETKTKELSLRKTALQRLSQKLVRHGYFLNTNEKTAIPTHKEIQDFQEFAKKHSFNGNEGWFLPEDKEYEIILNRVEKEDVILDIGAGNFALDILLAEKCQKVYAVEVNPFVVADALKIIGYKQPRNLIIICANGLDVPIPKDVNHLVMLLRHFSQKLAEKYLNIPKITAQIYETWILVPEKLLEVGV